MTRRLLTTCEIAAALRLSKQRVLQLIRSGELPAIRVGTRSIRVRPADLDRFLEERAA